MKDTNSTQHIKVVAGQITAEKLIGMILQHIPLGYVLDRANMYYLNNVNEKEIDLTFEPYSGEKP